VAWYFGLTVVQIPSLGDLEPNDVLAAIASLNATVLGVWLLVQIALETWRQLQIICQLIQVRHPPSRFP